LTLAQSISQANQALDSTLQNQLGALYDSDTNGTFQATGSNGSRIVYPQGTVSSNVNDGYYYPSFQSFDVTVTNNDGTYSTGPGTLTSYLNGMYGTMVYAVSASDQKTQNANANAENTSINTLFGVDWIANFGTGTSVYSDNSNSKWSWVTGQANNLANIAESQKFVMMQNSLQWVCLQATINSSVALQKKYQNYSFSELLSAVNGGTLKFTDIFTTLLTADGEMNPWTQQMYTQYQSINNAVTANSKNSQAAASNTGIINTAGSYLASYVTGTDSQMTDSNYATVYTNGTNSDTYPKYVPQVTYNKTPQAIAATITDTTGSGDSVSAGVYTADGSSNSVNIGSSSSSSSSVDATASDWFWTTSVSASMSSSNQQSFGSYDSAAAASSGTFDYGNLSFQSWDIPQTGNNAWLLSTQIQAAVSNDTPYIYSPSFTGGYGWTNSKDASTYTAQGLSYMKSLAFSGDPTTTITIQSDSDGSTYWSDNNYQSSSYSASGGFSFGDWFGGVGVGASTSSSDTYSDAQSSSTWDAASNTATLVSHPLGPIATTLNNPNAGYPAMQVGAGVVDVVAANSNYSSAASNRGKIKTSWHNVSPTMSGKNIKMDSSDNIIFGSSKRDVIKASKGDDELFGHDGRDELVGGSGDDFLSGGTGKDSYSGGPGKDFFELNSDHFGTGLITIVDFNQMADTLWCVHVNDDLLTAKGKSIFYDGDKVARVLNLNKSEVAAIVENNTTFVG
jgi:hypothetical protein